MHYRNIRALLTLHTQYIQSQFTFLVSLFLSEFFGAKYLEHIKLIITILICVFSVSLAGNEIKCCFTHWITTLITIVGILYSGLVRESNAHYILMVQKWNEIIRLSVKCILQIEHFFITWNIGAAPLHSAFDVQCNSHAQRKWTTLLMFVSNFFFAKRYLRDNESEISISAFAWQ